MKKHAVKARKKKAQSHSQAPIHAMIAQPILLRKTILRAAIDTTQLLKRFEESFPLGSTDRRTNSPKIKLKMRLEEIAADIQADYHNRFSFNRRERQELMALLEKARAIIGDHP